MLRYIATSILDFLVALANFIFSMAIVVAAGTLVLGVLYWISRAVRTFLFRE